MARNKYVQMVINILTFVPPAIPLLLMSLATNGTGDVFKDLVMYRTCQELPDNNYTCEILFTNASSSEAKDIQASVQVRTNLITMTDAQIQAGIMAVLSLFLGPWSDRGGRKPLLIASMTGSSVMFILLAVMSNWQMGAWFLIIPNLLCSMLGGSALLTFASVCYVTDSATEKRKTIVLACIQASIMAGGLMGRLAGSTIYGMYGFTVVYMISISICVLSLLYTYFFIRETVENPDRTLKGLFDPTHAKDLFTSLLMKREGFNRTVIWLGLFVMTGWLMVIMGESSVDYFNIRHRLGWDLQRSVLVSSIGTVVNIAGVIAGVAIFNFVLGCSDVVVGTIGIVSGIGGAITKSLITEDWHMYLALGIGAFTGVLAPVVRSAVSKAAPQKEQGKVFTLAVTLETVCPLFSIPVYSMIQAHLPLDIYPAPIYFVTAGIFVILFFALVWIEVLNRKASRSNDTKLSSTVDDARLSS